jgi:hypothetical protein
MGRRIHSAEFKREAAKLALQELDRYRPRIAPNRYSTRRDAPGLARSC